MFSFAVKHLSDTPGTGFTASRAVGSADLAGTGMKPVLKKYGIRTSYTVDEANGSEPYEVEAVFPSGTYSALDYTPVRSGYRFAGWSDSDEVLPYDAELEWVRNDPTNNFGSNGFSIGVVPNAADTSFEVKFGTFFNIPRDYGEVRNNVDQTINGTRLSFGFTCYRNLASHVDANGASVSNGTNVNSDFPIVGSYDCQTHVAEKVSPNGTSTSTVSSDKIDFPYTAQMALFKCFNNVSNRSTPMLLYYLKIWKNGVLVRDLVPVRIGTVGYLYDRANPTGGPNSNGIYPAQGSSKLITGPAATFSGLDTSSNVPFQPPAVHAVWTPELTVTFDATTNGGEMPSGWVAPAYYEGQPYGTLPVPTKSGSAFIGWFLSGFRIAESTKAANPSELVARYVVPTYDTSFEVTTTSSYRKTGIYAANSRNTANPTIVDWGDGSTSVVYGNISQLAHTYSSNGTFTVQVNDNISSFALSANNSTWYGTTTNNRYVVKKVTAIGSNVTSIPTYAFNYCSAMTDAVLPTTISSVPNYCFNYCQALKGITIPSNYTSIGQYAFQYCNSSSFTSVTIPASITSIGNYAFANCQYLHDITFEAATATLTLGSYCFYYCFCQSAAVGVIDMSPRRITTIPDHCFERCYYLKGITWPQGVTTINSQAFRYCFRYASSTGTVDIPEGVTSISGTYAFENCAYLTAVALPSTITNLNNYTFSACPRLATITCNRSAAPTVSAVTFGNGTGNYTGRNSYSAGMNRLYVPAGATGYTSSYWGSVLLDSTKCGFTLEEMQ